MKTPQFLIGLAASALALGASASTLLSEGFDDISTLAASGWAQTNNSTPGGTNAWFQGNPVVFTTAAGAGASNAYIGANFDNAPVGGNISNWLISPVLNLTGGAHLLYSLRVAGSGFLDIVEARLSTAGASTDVGGTDSSVGDFTTLLNTFFATDDNGWVTVDVDLGSVGPFTGRVAWRYLVNDTSVNGNYIGLDSVQVVPEPAGLALALLALGAAGLARRRPEV